VHSQVDLDAIADSLNGGLRATHNFRSPIEVFNEMMKKLKITHPAIH
jgi:IS30 family transposase